MSNSAQYSVSLSDFVKEFGLENIVPSIDLDNRKITTNGLNRPALQLAGFYDYFDNDRVQIIGNVERAYLERLEPAYREGALRKLFSFGFPCLIVTNNRDPFPEMIHIAQEFDVPIFKTEKPSIEFQTEANIWLSEKLAERVTIHGVLVDVYGVGVLIMGESGIGKSEAALELIKRGHRLVSDDVVEIRKVSDETLVGSAPDVTRHFIELRGIGIVDVQMLYGALSVRRTQNIELVITLEEWDKDKEYDRLGLEEQYTEFLGNKVVCHQLPIRPGRNLAIIVETAAINHKQKQMGYNAAQEFTKQINDHFDRSLNNMGD